MLMESRIKRVGKPNQKCKKSKDVILAELSQLQAAQNRLSDFLQEFYPLVSDPDTDCSLYNSIRFSAHAIRLKIEFRLWELDKQLQ